MPIYQYSFTAGEQKKIYAVGNFLRCLEGSNDFVVSMMKNDSKITLSKGLALTLEKLETEFDVVSSVNQTISLYIGKGKLSDERPSSSSPGGTSLNTAGDQAVPTGVATKIYSFNSNTKSVFVTNPPTSTVELRLAPIAGLAGPTSGIPVYAGQTMIIDSSGDIYCYQNSGVTINVPTNWIT